MSEAFDARRYAVRTEDTFFMYGWVPLDSVESFIKNLEAQKNVRYTVVEPGALGDHISVKLKNRWLFRAFEPFVEMYGLPSYNEFDPTPLMAVLYTLLFGIMFGDVGQGILVSVIGFLMYKLKKMWLGKVLVYAGIAGCCFGFFYGSVFGFEELLPFGFHALESSANTSLMLQTAVYLGVLLISLVIIVNVINGIRQKQYEKAIFGQNGIAGLILYWAVMLLVLPLLGFLDISISSPVFIICAFVLPLILVLLRDPLGKLVSGDPDWKPDNLLDFLLENIFELVEVLLSYVTNTVSFLRVGIFALSHAGMMTVVFLLAGEPRNPVVVILGNLVVMGIEGLLVGIQVLRLNFYEMFGRFFEADGRAYSPITINYKSANE